MDSSCGQDTPPIHLINLLQASAAGRLRPDTPHLAAEEPDPAEIDFPTFFSALSEVITQQMLTGYVTCTGCERGAISERSAVVSEQVSLLLVVVFVNNNPRVFLAPSQPVNRTE